MTFNLDEIIEAKVLIAKIEAVALYGRAKSVEIPGKPKGSKPYRQGALAELFHVTSSTVGRWRDKEGLPHLPNSREIYDLAEAWNWFGRNKQSKLRSLDPRHIEYVRRLISS